MLVQHDSPQGKNDTTPTNALPPLTKRLALSQAPHPGTFAEVIWEVEPYPARRLVSSLYAMAGNVS